MNLTDHREDAEIAALADATLLRTRSMAKSVELGMTCAEGLMNIASAIAFDTAEREYNDAWNAPSSTRFELPPVDVNKVLKERYRVSLEQTVTRAMIWDMETKKDASLRMFSSATPSRPSIFWDGRRWSKKAATLL
jgi:hypothetical protein